MILFCSSKQASDGTDSPNRREEDDLLSRSKKKCQRRSSGYFFGCHDMSQVIDIEPVEGITNAPQSQQAKLVGVTYLERIPFL